MTLSFNDPYVLWLLLLIPVIGFLHWRFTKPSAIQFSSVALTKRSRNFKRSKARAILLFLRLTALTVLVIALARPQFAKGESIEEAQGIDIVLALDISSSMLALDFSSGNKLITRLEVAKSVIEDFIERRYNDRIALIAFSGDPYLVSPLTLNHSWLKSNLERLRVGLVPDGTAIGNAIAMSVNRLKDIPSKSRVVILLTDGVNNSGQISPIAAAEAAASYDTKIYTIAAGLGGVVPTLYTNRNGDIVRNVFGQPDIVKTDLPVDEETLIEISKITKAHSYRASNLDELKNIYDEIDQLEKTEVKIKSYAQYDDIYIIPLLIGICCLGLEKLLTHTRYRRIP